MIAQLTGLLADFDSDTCIIDVHGVGWLVHASSRTLAQLGAIGDTVTLYTRMQVSDNDMRLIGFASASERKCYALLINVQGVGSKVALAILSALTPADVGDALATGDKTIISRAQGVGPKLAARIVNELKDKAASLPRGSASVGNAGGSNGGAVSGGTSGSLPESHSADAMSALGNLGFKPADAERAVSAALAELGDDASLDALVRMALKKAAS